MFEVICSKLRNCHRGVLEPLLEMAVEIAREGREGRRIGTLFTLGDAQAVMAWSRPLILDPLAGHPARDRRIASQKLWGTIKELAQLDGAFVVSDRGVFVAAARYLDTNAGLIKVPFGLGSRHIAAASITFATKAAAIAVSESSIVRVFEHGALIAEIIPELWLLTQQELALRGSVRKDQRRHLAIVTPGLGQPKAGRSRSAAG
jgi:diadenylate cyclase